MATNTALRPLTGDSDVDEYVELEPEAGDGYTTEDTDDGGMLVTVLGDGAERSRDEEGGFYENLADALPEVVLDKIATDLLRKIEEDKKSREKRDEQYEEGIRRTGLGKDAPGGAQFEGASKVVHPMLTEACVDCNSRIMKELWPMSGPVKARILGEVTKQKVERAERKAAYMNHQLTTIIEEARATAETTFTQLPLGGVQYIRQWQDHRLKRPRWQFVPVDKVYLPATAADFHSSHRRTWSDTISAVELRERTDSGMYRDLKLPPPPSIPEGSKTEKANEKIEGVDKSGTLNLDGDREIYETMVKLEVTEEMADFLDHEESDELYPYLITIDESSKRVLALYRDWEEKDETKKPIEHLFEFPFIPWRGPLAIGLPQMIGGLSGGATGALRALLDSAYIANTQGGLIIKGSGSGGQTKTGQVGEFVEIESNLSIPDIRKMVMPFNTKEPSNVLFQLLGFLVDAAKSTIRTSLDEMITENPNTPVGTQLSLVEEGLTVFSAIHGRVHASFNRLLEGLHRLNRLYLPKAVKAEIQGKEILVYRKDFEGSPDIQPVSDPTIYSDQQRFLQIAAIEDSAMKFPNLYNMRAVQKRKLKLWKVADMDELLAPAQDPTELNAVNENLAMSMGRPVQVFPDQDHRGHLQVHLDFMKSPVLGSNPLIAPKFMPLGVQHCAEHIVYEYVSMMNDMITRAAGMPAVKLMSKDENVKKAFDRLLALASQQLVPNAEQEFGQAMPVLLDALQKLQRMAPPAPVDPAHAALAAAQAETQRKGAADQAQGALGQAKLQSDAALKNKGIDAKAQSDAQRNAIAAERNDVTRENADVAARTRIEQTEIESETARDIASTRISEGRQPGFSTGRSLGQA